MADTEFALSDVRTRIESIGQALIQADPMLPVHLGNILKTLKENEELVHLLSPEEVKTLIAGQKKHVAVQLVKETVSEKRGPKLSTSVEDM